MYQLHAARQWKPYIERTKRYSIFKRSGKLEMLTMRRFKNRKDRDELLFLIREERGGEEFAKNHENSPTASGVIL
jgi:hypothetical protein